MKWLRHSPEITDSADMLDQYGYKEAQWLFCAYTTGPVIYVRTEHSQVH